MYEVELEKQQSNETQAKADKADKPNLKSEQNQNDEEDIDSYVSSSSKVQSSSTLENSEASGIYSLDISKEELSKQILELNWQPHNSKHEFDPTKMQYYLASGHTTNFKFVGDKLHKAAKKRQLEYYQNNQYQSKFNPICYGIQNDQLVIENLLHDMPEPSVLDIKLGRYYSMFKVNNKKLEDRLEKMSKSSSEKLGFRISGYATPEAKEFNLKIKDEQKIRQLLRKCISKENVPKVLQFVTNMKIHLSTHNRIYQGTSLVIVANATGVKVRWIDMSYWAEIAHPDHDMLEGLENLAIMLKGLY